MQEVPLYLLFQVPIFSNSFILFNPILLKVQTMPANSHSSSSLSLVVSLLLIVVVFVAVVVLHPKPPFSFSWPPRLASSTKEKEHEAFNYSLLGDHDSPASKYSYTQSSPTQEHVASYNVTNSSKVPLFQFI